MTDNSPNSRLIKNEQIIRDHNSRTTRHLRRFFRNDKSSVEAPLNFLCECSDLSCNEHVQLSIKEYEALHQRQDRFVIYKGHDTPAVEKIVANHHDYLIVEKYALKA